MCVKRAPLRCCNGGGRCAGNPGGDDGSTEMMVDLWREVRSSGAQLLPRSVLPWQGVRSAVLVGNGRATIVGAAEGIRRNAVHNGNCVDKKYCTLQEEETRSGG